MNQYKADFDAKDKSQNPDNIDLKFKYQDDDLETRYRKFMIDAQEKDEIYQGQLKSLAEQNEKAAKEAQGHKDD